MEEDVAFSIFLKLENKVGKMSFTTEDGGYTPIYKISKTLFILFDT